MGYEILLVGIWGGIVAMDTTAAFQLMISHPLVSCSVVGLLLGNFPMGFLVGILLELPWLYEIPTGGARFAEGNIGSTTAAAITIHLVDTTGRIEVSVALAIIVGILVSMIGGILIIIMRQSNARLIESVLTKPNLTPSSITRHQLAGVGRTFIMGGVLTAATFYLFGCLILSNLISLIPVDIDAALTPIFGALMGVGCAVFLILIMTKQNWWLLAIGLILGSLVFL